MRKARGFLVWYLVATPLLLYTGFAGHSLAGSPPKWDWRDSEAPTDAVVILHHGKTVFEWSKNPGTLYLNQKHPLWSISKSFISLVFGAAERKGFIKRNEFVCLRTPELCTKAMHDVKFQHLLQMTTGLRMREVYETNPVFSDALSMLYGGRKEGMGFFAASFRRRRPPGENWEYSSGTTNILATALAITIQKEAHEDFHTFFKNEILKRAGISDFTWETDLKGYPVGSSYLFMSPRDLARAGQWILESQKTGHAPNGLPDDWWDFSLTLPSAVRERPPSRSEGEPFPGAHWWLNVPDPEGDGRPLPDVPRDAFAALGHWGQSLWIIPSKDLVVARVAQDRKGRIDRNRFLRTILAWLRENQI